MFVAPGWSRTQRLFSEGAKRRKKYLADWLIFVGDVREVSYEAVFQTLFGIGDVNEGEGAGLHEELLAADPRSKDGRPGSAP